MSDDEKKKNGGVDAGDVIAYGGAAYMLATGVIYGIAGPIVAPGLMVAVALKLALNSARKNKKD